MKIIVTSGGTGGHIYPALSLCKYLENNGEEILFVGGKNKLEEEIIKKEDIEFRGLELENSKGVIGKIKLLINLIKQIKVSLKIIKEYKPDLVIGFGNYISLPVCIASILKGIPLFLHEQNSIMGKANVLLGFFAKKIGYSIPLIKEKHKNKLVNVGNPRSNDCLKNTISNIKINVSKNNVLIFMGSLGSTTINNILKEFIDISDNDNEYHIVTGKKYYQTFIKNIKEKDNIHIYPYIENMTSFMKKCDLVITRSGATTISEIVTLGMPSILIPSPYVTNNHQYHNAKYLLDKEAAFLLEERNLTSRLLKEKIDYLLNNKNERIKLRINSLKLAVFDSNNKIYKIIKEIANGK